MGLVERVTKHGAARPNGVDVANPAAFLKKQIPIVHRWLTEVFYDDARINAYVVLRNYSTKGEPTSVALSIWSETYEFVVSIQVGTGKKLPSASYKSRRIIHHGPRVDRGYIGAGLVCRAPYVGEQHRRGSDLFDGPFSEETWRGVLEDILRHSLLEIHEWARRIRPDGTAEHRRFPPKGRRVKLVPARRSRKKKGRRR